MQIPDLIYDGIDLWQEPNINNGIHFGFDVLKPVVRATKGTADDTFIIPGIIDDAYTGITGEDGLEVLDRKSLEFMQPMPKASNYQVKNNNKDNNKNKNKNK